MPRKCINCNIKRPVFGLPTDTKAQYCGDCKTDGMIDLKNPKCINCNIKHPNFGLPTDTKAQYCGDCKTDGMIDLKSPNVNQNGVIRDSVIKSMKDTVHIALCTYFQINHYQEIIKQKN